MSPAADALQSSLSGSSATRVSRPTPLACPGACAPGRSDACAADRPAHVAMADRSAAARVGAGGVADAGVLRAVPTPGREGSATGSRVCDSRGTLHRAVGSRWWRWLPVGSCRAAMQESPVWGTGGPRKPTTTATAVYVTGPDVIPKEKRTMKRLLTILTVLAVAATTGCNDAQIASSNLSQAAC